MRSRLVYCNEYNIRLHGSVYLPIVSGQLRAYCETFDDLRSHYRFAPFIHVHAPVAEILAQVREPPDVAVFSLSMWNERLSLAVAAALAAAHPACVMIFGGPQVPFAAERFFAAHPFVTATIRGEGERPFAAVLRRLLTTRDLSGIPGVSWRDPASGAVVRNPDETELPDDLDEYPSPYLLGLFDDLLGGRITYHAIIETNRGCPFQCGYCFWGQGGLSRRVRFFSLDRVRRLADWIGDHRIEYVFCADGNFGMFPRDVEIAETFAAVKARTGFPERFRTCFAKNTEGRVLQIGRILAGRDLDKGITMSFQSLEPAALANVGRANIRLEVYENLQRAFNREGIPVYTELILGLPGETLASFVAGLEQVLAAGIRNQLFIYLCQVYPNTGIAEPEFRRRHGLQTVQIPLLPVHGTLLPPDSVPEREEVVVATATLPPADWRRALVAAWLVQLFFGLKLASVVSVYLWHRHRFRLTALVDALLAPAAWPRDLPCLRRLVAGLLAIADRITAGGPRVEVVAGFGDVYWEPEEAAFLELTGHLSEFYTEVESLAAEMIASPAPFTRSVPESAAAVVPMSGAGPAPAVPVDRDDEGGRPRTAAAAAVEGLAAAVALQRALVPVPAGRPAETIQFTENLPQFVAQVFRPDQVPLTGRKQAALIAACPDRSGDLPAFAREVIIFGRKRDRILRPFSWRDVDA